MTVFERPTAVVGFKGQVLTSSDPEYDEARQVFNGMIDRRPALIMKCSDTFDVITAVNHARSQNLPLSVYGGGHGVTGSAVVDGGVCIDLRAINEIAVDPASRTAWVDRTGVRAPRGRPDRARRHADVPRVDGW